VHCGDTLGTGELEIYLTEFRVKLYILDSEVDEMITHPIALVAD